MIDYKINSIIEKDDGSVVVNATIFKGDLVTKNRMRAGKVVSEDVYQRNSVVRKVQKVFPYGALKEIFIGALNKVVDIQSKVANDSVIVEQQT